MSVRILLSRPVKVSGGYRTHITLKLPASEELASASIWPDSAPEPLRTQLSHLAESAELPSEVLGGMPACDFIAIMEAYIGLHKGAPGASSITEIERLVGVCAQLCDVKSLVAERERLRDNTDRL